MARRPSAPTRPPSASGDGDRLTPLFAGAGLALIVARHVLPAESSHLGETLWIVALWLLLALGWTFARVRRGASRIRWDRADLAVLLLAGGYVLAGAIGHGNQRAALNGLWEWIGVAVAVGLMRRWLANEARWQQWLAAIETIGVVLSGLGVEQYAVEHPALRREMQELIDLEGREQRGELSERDVRRFQQLRSELGELATNSDANARFTLRQRLMASTEPLACFALANTLAGVLSVSLLLLAGAAATAMTGGHSRLHVARIVAPALLIGFCLVLTKSRTAWIGTLVGACAWGLVAWRAAWVTRRTLGLLVGALLAAATLVGIAWWAGALDPLVLLESSKSLRYRMEYWTGAWGVIRDHLLFGIGPGNFRQNYLRHKVAGSSEEILDPHNMFLDAWAGGGVLALAGLAFAACIAVARWRNVASDAPAPFLDDDRSKRPASRLVLLSGAAGMLLVWIKLGLIELQWDQRLVALICGWIVACVLLPPLRFSRASQMAAGIALGVHLLGAGGIGMPVISTTLLLLWLGPAPAPGWEAAPDVATARLRSGAAACIVIAGLTAYCLYSAVIPATLAGLYSDAAVSVMTRGDVPASRRFLQQAILADPLDPEPHVFLAQLEHDQFRLSGGQNAGKLAVQELSEAIARDPENPKTYWLQAKYSLELAGRSGDRQFVESAVTSAEAAARRDPQNAPILATLATAHARAGHSDKAREAAMRALAIDDLNRSLGHVDRLLDEVTRASLQTLADIPGE
ncbi:MAG: O-antigen ligase family protein [Planctomycetaceae bacterium]|nr:O-antigen ligase family protein [Planctomycetaceae bacterium]